MDRHRPRATPLLSLVVLVLLPPQTPCRELDPGACAARFDVQRDKIIRTEESRAMGARYLSELDVGSRAECRRLCCETDACDVFVLEEQSPGSCYLFACGPPEDFRCKFTAHGNFSSGVLALSRRLAELQDQERRAGPAAATATTPAHTSAASTRAPPALTTHAPRRCSRYQFECHSGGECIAVYNACDGVPQCADGSDEGPELGCPAVAPPSPAVAAAAAGWPARLAQAQADAQAQARAQARSQARLLGPAPLQPAVRAHRPPPPPPPPYGEEVAEGLMRGPVDGGGWQWGASWGAPVFPAPAGKGPVEDGAPPVAPPTRAAPPRAPPPPPTPASTSMHLDHVEKTSMRSVHERLLSQSQSQDAEEGPAERPTAAALLLVLGLAMAVAAAALALGCGARRGRRGARGLRGSARADYLVNGMYL